MTDTATLPPREMLKSARAMAEALPTRWAGEGADYRAARTALLAEEIELRRQIQRVAQQRRALPPGPVAKDYRFLDEQGNELGLVAFVLFKLFMGKRLAHTAPEKDVLA